MTRPNTKLGTILVLGLFAVPSSHATAAQTAAYTPPSYGPAYASCGSWTAGSPVILSPPRSNGTGDRGIFLIWVEGFVTGAGFAGPENIKTATTDADGIQGWVTKYCTDHPLDSLLVAAASLVAELRTRAKS
jgi:hypothetical protein